MRSRVRRVSSLSARCVSCDLLAGNVFSIFSEIATFLKRVDENLIRRHCLKLFGNFYLKLAATEKNMYSDREIILKYLEIPLPENMPTKIAEFHSHNMPQRPVPSCTAMANVRRSRRFAGDS